MMKNGLLEKIRGIGHWRLNLKPLLPLADRLTLQACLDEVRKARVYIRGWDFPHTTDRNDETSGTDREVEYAGQWCDWERHPEFWRMYRSGQFLAYKAVYEDVGRSFSVDHPPALHITQAIYTVTEFVEFASRLSKNGLYKDGFHLQLSLNSAPGRVLEVGPGRMPFMDHMVTHASAIPIDRRVRADETGEPMPIALGILQEIFDYYGWSPPPEQIQPVQEAFYRREFR